MKTWRSTSATVAHGLHPEEADKTACNIAIVGGAYLDGRVTCGNCLNVENRKQKNRWRVRS